MVYVKNILTCEAVCLCKGLSPPTDRYLNLTTLRCMLIARYIVINSKALKAKFSGYLVSTLVGLERNNNFFKLMF